MNKTILCIAFHFPPIATSSGMQRSLKFVRYLREDGWRPVVLTIHPRAYGRTNESQLGEIPADVPVYRAFGLDATRHLAVRRRYPGWLALPDPWSSWYAGAIPAGLGILRRHKPALIWSTFPIATATLIALTLARWSGLPWIADFRDPMTMDGYPADPRRWKAFRWIERHAVARAAHCVFTAQHTLDMYKDRYPALREHATLIPNGYDESNFPARRHRIEPVSNPASRPLRLVHSGAMQPDGRNPGPLFSALARLRRDGVIDPGSFRLVLRACEFEADYRRLAEGSGVADLVEFAPHLPYEAAIEEMVDADGLLVFQGQVYNHTVPAKLYEFLYARRPIFALVDPAGETNKMLRGLGIDSTANITDPADIATQLQRFLAGLRGGTVVVPGLDQIAPFSRRRQAGQLSALMAGILAANSAGGTSPHPQGSGSEPH